MIYPNLNDYFFPIPVLDYTILLQNFNSNFFKNRFINVMLPKSNVTMKQEEFVKKQRCQLDIEPIQR